MLRISTLLAACAANVVGLVASTAASATDWPQFGGGPAHEGYNPFEQSLSSSSISGLDQAWAANSGDPHGLTIAGGTAFVVTLNSVEAIDLTRGASRWSAPLDPGGGVLGPAAVSDGVVYVAAKGGRIVGFPASCQTPC